MYIDIGTENRRVDFTHWPPHRRLENRAETPLERRDLEVGACGRVVTGSDWGPSDSSRIGIERRLAVRGST
jgi:hypothetical protein